MDPKKFDELIDGGETEAPQEETRALHALAQKLTEMADDSELSDKAADRIFAMVNAKLDAEQAANAPARSRVGLLAAHMPRPLIQRQADALATAIEQLRAGQRPALAGEMALMAGAAASLRPLPAIKPSPSFVDWLEVRLMSPKLEMGSESSSRAWLSNVAANLSAVFESGRVQAGMAGAAAVIAAMALLSINVSDDPAVRTTRPSPQTVASPDLPQDSLVPGPADGLSASTQQVATAPAPPQDEATRRTPRDPGKVVTPGPGAPGDPTPPDTSGDNQDFAAAGESGRNLIVKTITAVRDQAPE